MNTPVKIFSIVYLMVTSLAVLVMLVNSFEQFDKKYLPSFLLAQKYALPIIATSLSFVFLVFFEPERLQRRSNIRFMKIISIITVVLFAYFLSSVNLKETATISMLLYCLQLILTIATAAYFFTLRPLS
jgi:cell division protein FtsW (lipid II flippase)